jgi:transposase
MIEASSNISELVTVGRRQWSAEDRHRIVSESLEPGASVPAVAQRNGVNANQLYRWRRHYAPDQKKVSSIAGFASATVSSTGSSAAARPGASVMGRIEIELPGGYRLIVGRDVDRSVLDHVIGVLSR